MSERVGEHQGSNNQRDRPVELIVMAKPVSPGSVKTRLAEDLGNRRAAQIYELFLHDLADQMSAFVNAKPDRFAKRDGVVAYTEDSSQRGYEPFRDRGFAFTPQGSGGLGERMERVTRRRFDEGAGGVVVVGTDSPTLSAAHIEKAVASIDKASTDVALGPAFDGGYYLIGLAAPTSVPFEGIDWSSRCVLAQTLRRCRQRNLLCDLLEFWYDVDTLADLRFMRDHLLEYLVPRNEDVAVRTADWLDRQGAEL